MAIKFNEVKFNRPVYWDPQTEKFHEISWIGRLWRWFPFVAQAQDKKIFDLFVKKLCEFKLTPDNPWFLSAKKFERSKFGRSLSKNQKESLSRLTFRASLAPLVDGDPKYLAGQREFLKFLKFNHLEKKIKNQNHLIKIIHQEPHLLFEGKWTSWTVIKALLNITKPETFDLLDNGYSYLGEAKIGNTVKYQAGIVKYNPTKWETPRPYRQLSEEEIKQLKNKGIQLPYIENIVDCRADKFPDRALENNDHCFKKMVDENGWVYYFGLSPKERKSYYDEISNSLASHQGVIESPDHYADVPPNIRESIIHNCTKEQFDREFNFIVELKKCGITYNVFENNCIELMLAADKWAHLPIPPAPNTKIKFYKILPKPFQLIYCWTPLPLKIKRWAFRNFLSLIGFSKGETVDGYKINAKTSTSLENDLKIHHPRKYLIWLQKQKQNFAST